MRRSAAVLALLALLVLVACGDGGDGGGGLVLDGRPRHADDEGVVTAVTRERLTLDGDRTYRVSRRLRAFSTRTLEAVPLLGRSGQYVLVGVDGDTVEWLASIGGVVRVPGRPAVTYYTGVLERVRGGVAEFDDGTVLGVGRGVEVPRPGRVRAEIDVTAHLVRRLTAL